MKIEGTNLNEINFITYDKCECDITLKEFIIEGTVHVVDWYGNEGTIELPMLGIEFSDELIENSKVNLDKLLTRIYDVAHTDNGYGVQEILSAEIEVYQVLKIKVNNLGLTTSTHVYLFSADIDYVNKKITVKE